MHMNSGKLPNYSQQYEIPIPSELSSRKKLIGVNNKNKDVIQYSRQTPQVREYDERKSYPQCHHYRDLYKEGTTPFYNLKKSMDIIPVLNDVIEGEYIDFHDI